MEEKIIQEIVQKRVQENQNLFTKEELEYIEGNIDLMKKMYLLGLINGRETYNNYTTKKWPSKN